MPDHHRPVVRLRDVLARDPVWDGSQWRLTCPIHAGHNPTAFRLNPTNGTFVCFACGATGQLREFWGGGVPPLRPDLLPPPARTPQDRYSTAPNGAQRGGQSRAQRYTHPPAPPPPDHSAWLAAAQERLARQPPAAVAYLHQRRISLATAHAAGLGYAPRYRFSPVVTAATGEKAVSVVVAPALLFPLVGANGDRESCPSIYARGCGPARLHRLTRGPRGVFVLPARETRQPVIIVEGCFDALALWESGYGGMVVALVGVALHPFVQRLAAPILIAFDPDAAGQRAQEKARATLRAGGRDVRAFTHPPWHGDADIAAFWQRRPRPLDWPRVLRQTA